MRGRSEDEQTLIKIQREWAEARVKGDSSYARRVEANDLHDRLAGRQDRE